MFWEVAQLTRRTTPFVKRIESLDYLRGAMAVSVMLYHYLGGMQRTFDSDSLCGRLGVYAVVTFYVLSGLSLTIVYGDRFRNPADYRAYVTKRLLRIAPLFSVVVTLVVLLGVIRNRVGLDEGFSINVWQLFLNYSLLFGFVKPDAYLPTGAWSIGNEMVFYAFLPILIVLGRKGRAWALGQAIVLSVPFVYFAFVAITPTATLASRSGGLTSTPSISCSCLRLGWSQVC